MDETTNTTRLDAHSEVFRIPVIVSDPADDHNHTYYEVQVHVRGVGALAPTWQLHFSDFHISAYGNLTRVAGDLCVQDGQYIPRAVSARTVRELHSASKRLEAGDPTIRWDSFCPNDLVYSMLTDFEQRLTRQHLED